MYYTLYMCIFIYIYNTCISKKKDCKEIQQNDNSDYCLVVSLRRIFSFLYFYKCPAMNICRSLSEEEKAYEDIKHVSGSEQKLLF